MFYCIEVSSEDMFYCIEVSPEDRSYCIEASPEGRFHCIEVSPEDRFYCIELSPEDMFYCIEVPPEDRFYCIEVSPEDWFYFIEVSPKDRFLLHRGVPWRQVLLYIGVPKDRFLLYRGVPWRQVSQVTCWSQHLAVVGECESVHPGLMSLEESYRLSVMHAPQAYHPVTATGRYVTTVRVESHTLANRNKRYRHMHCKTINYWLRFIWWINQFAKISSHQMKKYGLPTTFFQ